MELLKDICCVYISILNKTLLENKGKHYLITIKKVQKSLQQSAAKNYQNYIEKLFLYEASN